MNPRISDPEPGRPVGRASEAKRSGPVGTGPIRCAAAHPEDRSPCDGPADAVRVVDPVGDGVIGCVQHAAVALASIEGARVYPHSVDEAAIEAFQRAQLLEPFEFDPDRPWPIQAAASDTGAVVEEDPWDSPPLVTGQAETVHTGPESRLEVAPTAGRSVLVTAIEGPDQVQVRLSAARVDQLCQALCNACPPEDLPPLPEVQVVARPDLEASAGPAAGGRDAAGVGSLVVRAEHLRNQLTEALRQLAHSGESSVYPAEDRQPQRETSRSTAAESGWC